jgi:hypothetical protein
MSDIPPVTVSLNDLMKNKPETILEDLIAELRTAPFAIYLTESLDRAEARLQEWNGDE